MIMVDKNRKFNSENGQALFEMIIFLPFLIFLFTIFYTAGNAINGSINQQKALRGYFYQVVKGNSYLLTHEDLKSHSSNGIKIAGFNAIGWNETLINEKRSMAPCFKFSNFLKSNSKEECESPDREEEGSSQIIRVFTMYGVCGPTYFENQEFDGSGKFYSILPEGQSGISSCTLSK